VKIRLLAMLALVGGTAFGAGGPGCQKREPPPPPAPAPKAPGPPPVAGPRTAPGGPAAPAQGAEELAAPLARIDDVTITLGELQERINRQSPYIRARYTSLEQKKEFLDSLIRFEVLAKEAARRGLDRDPEVVRTMKQVMIQKLMRDELDAKITADTVSDAEMRAYYNANLADYVKPEEVRVSAIIVKSRAQAERVASEARSEAGKTNKGFRDLVARYSQDEDSKLRGGDLRYLDATTHDVPAPVVKATFALTNTGDVSGVVDAGNGTWYVLKQTGRRRAMTKSFDDAKPAIRNKLFRDKRVAAQKDFVDRLRTAARIEVDEANLAKVRIDTSQAVDDGRGHDLPPLPMSVPLPADPPGEGRAGGRPGMP
jgi:peptidyl-prolyl cis-trans isomerase C